MKRIHQFGLLVVRLGAFALIAALLAAPLSGIAVADGTSGGFPPPDSTRQPVINPDSDGTGLIDDVRVFLASPWMTMM